MTQQEIIDCLTDNLGTPFTKLLAEKASNDPTVLQLLIKIAVNGPHPADWRAAWTIDHVAQIDKKLVEPHLPALIDHIFTVKRRGVQRHFLKLVSQGPIENLNDGRLVDLCLNWMMAETTPIACKAHCMEIMRRLTGVFPELANELIPILQDIAMNGSKGEKNKAGKILAQMEKRMRLPRMDD